MSTPNSPKDRDKVVVDAVERFAPAPPTPSTPRSSGEEAAYNVAASVTQSILPATPDVGENPVADRYPPFAGLATPAQHINTNDQADQPGELDDWIQRAATKNLAGAPMQPALLGTANLPAETTARPPRRYLTRRPGPPQRARPPCLRAGAPSERAAGRFAQRPAIIAAGVLLLSIAGGAALLTGGSSGVRGQISEAAVTPPSALESAASRLQLNPFGARPPIRRAGSNHVVDVRRRRTPRTHAATRPHNTTTAVAARYTPSSPTSNTPPAYAQTPSDSAPSSTPAPSSPPASSNSQPAFGLNGALGPGHGNGTG